MDLQDPTPRSARATRGHAGVYLAFIFLTGAVTLALELLASRVMTPYFGVSLYIWTGILSITLVALSLGYYLGGRLTGTGASERVGRLEFHFLLMPALSSLAISVSCLAYPITFSALAGFSLVVGSLVACMVLLFAPLVAHSGKCTNKSATTATVMNCTVLNKCGALKCNRHSRKTTDTGFYS